SFFMSSRRRHTRSKRDWSSDVCSSDLFLWGAVSEFLPWTSIQLVSSGEDILVSEALDRSSLWDKGPEQAIVSLVLRTLPGGVRRSEERRVGKECMYRLTRSSWLTVLSE